MITAINNYSSVNFQGRQDYPRKYLSEPAKQVMDILLERMAPEVTVSPNGLTFSGKFLTMLKGKFGQKFEQPLSGSRGGTISGKYPPFQVEVDKTGRITKVGGPSLFGFKFMSRERILQRAEKVLGYFSSNFDNPTKVQKNKFYLQGFTKKGWEIVSRSN